MPMTVTVIMTPVTIGSFGVATTRLADAAPVYEGLAYNLNTAAPSLYAGLQFGSMAKVGSRYLAVRTDGLFELGGGTDAGVPIDAVVTLGVSDLAADLPPQQGELQKGLDAVYVGGISPSPLDVSLTTDDGVRTYRATSTAGVFANMRVNTGKGMKSRYIGAEIANTAGGALQVDSVSLRVSPLSRHTP